MGYGELYVVLIVAQRHRPKASDEHSLFGDTQIMWNDLKKRYGMANTLRIQQLKVDITKSK